MQNIIEISFIKKNYLIDTEQISQTHKVQLRSYIRSLLITHTIDKGHNIKRKEKQAKQHSYKY